MKRPVFIVGCPRSGTTLLYSMLLAAGGFAVYRKETYFYDLVGRFPDLPDPRSHGRFTAQFLEGYLGKVPGLEVEPFVQEALRQCRNPGEFLPLLMNAITRAQGMDRWVEATPSHVLHMDAIVRFVPDALFVHVVRDGRDCALSNIGQRWVPAFPWDAGRRLGVAALYWEWMMRAGRTFGQAHPDRYFELRFEDLIADPRATLDSVGRFIDHDLSYDVIQEHRVHALHRPNTSFRDERDRPDFNPVGRWKDKCSPTELQMCEAVIGAALEMQGYPLAHPAVARRRDLRALAMRATYLPYFRMKHWVKAHTRLRRFVTSTHIWTEQPRAGERPIEPFRRAAPVAACAGPLSSTDPACEAVN